MSESYRPQTSIMVYYRDSFFGRDAGDNFQATSGLTGWVAENFDHLGLGNPPYGEDRRVHEGNRARWEDYSVQFLEWWFPGTVQRYVLRRLPSVERRGRDGPETHDTFILFPHPDDAGPLQLRGARGILPAIRIGVSSAHQNLMANSFTTVSRSNLSESDLELVATVKLEQFPFDEPWEAKQPSDAVLQRMRSMESAVQITGDRLTEWESFLDWQDRRHDRNAWEVRVEGPPEVRPAQHDVRLCFTCVLDSEENHLLGALKRAARGRKGGKEEVFAVQRQVETLPDAHDGEWFARAVQQMMNRVEENLHRTAIGRLHHLKEIQPDRKGGPRKFEVVVNLNESTNPSMFQGNLQLYLSNEVDEKKGTLKRERKGLERLRDLEGENNLHEWLFDISKARRGHAEPPLLQYETVAELNDAQERAVRGALAAEDVYLVQGPPGTGKTTVIAEIINQATQRGERVLVASQTNVAVDNAFSRLASRRNVRPIRWLGHFASLDPDPDSEPFLENNVVRSFFLEAIKRECAEANASENTLRENQRAVERFLDQMPRIQEQLASLRSEHRELAATIEGMERGRHEAQNELATLVQAMDKTERLRHQISAEPASQLLQQAMSDAGLDVSTIQKSIEHEQAAGRASSVEQLLVLLKGAPSGGSDDSEVRRLEQAMHEAAARQEFLLAEDLKAQRDARLEALKGSATSSWAIWTRSVSRVARELEFEPALALASNIDAPLDLAEQIREMLPNLEGQLSRLGEIEPVDEQEWRGPALARIDDQLSEFKSLCQNLEQGDKEHEAKMGEMNANRTRLVTLIQQAEEDSNALISVLPASIREDGQPVDHATLESESRAWISEQQTVLQRADRWHTLREDWVDAIDGSTSALVEDLTDTYLQMVNVEGVTTSYAGSYHWYSDRAARPFDIVIIDEISKATPPEMVLALLLGRKAVLVGDHKQLPPHFDDPGRSHGEDEDAEDHEERKRFESMATTALFEELFKGAHGTLKTTLNVQYRMHHDIMEAVNPFYNGELSAGLLEQEGELKQHGMRIKSEVGTHKGSDLIRPNRALYWVDSAFDRTDAYRSEERPEGSTSKVNRREIDLVEHLLEKFDQQLATAKEDTPKDTWHADRMLRHLDSSGRLPVGVISMYLAQKNELHTMLARGAPPGAKQRWSNLDVRVDTVDRFQGGERPVILCSLVQSPKIEANQAPKLSRLLKRHDDPSGFINKNLKSTKNTWRSPEVRGRFVRSPNRLNVAFSRAQNLLIIIGNRWAYEDARVDIEDEDGFKQRKRYFANLHRKIGKGGMLDGRDLL